MSLDVHVVTHTHWDREWYQPFEIFRQRLVALIDELLATPPDSRESFLLDGQAILIDDYLAVRPERNDELCTLLAAGRLEAGPWYVLADELIPSGEALVRNLLAGRRVLQRCGAVAPPVLYCPDSFGHPAVLPELARGFGLPLIVLWRGYGGPRWPVGDTVRWEAPSGASVPVYHLPRDGYEFGSHLPPDPPAAAERWQRMRRELVPRSVSGVLLVPNGADHHARQSRLDEALDALEATGAEDGVHRSSLRSFAERLVERATERELPLIRGELRDSYGYTWSLQGTFATRAHEKRANAHAERMLLREAEPWSALAATASLGRMSRKPLVEHAWRTLLTAHPHDTLCGCSIDHVARAMELRVEAARQQATGIRDGALADLVGHDPVAAREARDGWRPIVLLRNAAPRARSGVAIIEIERWLADVPVGPASAGVSAESPAPPRELPRVPGLGRLQRLSQRVEASRTESPRHYPDNDLVAVDRVAAWVSDAPPYGIVAHSIGEGRRDDTAPTEPVVAERLSLRNAMLRVDVSEAGVVTLVHRDSGRRIESLLEVIDESDVGDLYTPAPRPRDVVVEFRGARHVHRGPLRGELALRYRILPAGKRRQTDVELAVHVVLDADAPFLRLVLHGENHRENHRLRLAVRSDVGNGAVWADAAFGPVRREPIVVGPLEAGVEQPPPTAPLHRYVSRFDDVGGFTVFSDGLAEYEARPDGSMVVTLVRAVGELSRNDLPERPGHAGWPTPTPAAQCLGHFEAELAVMFHGPRNAATIDEIERTSDDVLLPLTGRTLRSALEVPAPVTGVELVGQGLAFSAIKESEDGQWLVLRCVNLLDDEVEGCWRLPWSAAEAYLARLDETVITQLAVQENAVAFRADPRVAMTVLVGRRVGASRQ